MTIQEQIAAKKAELAAAQSESPVNGDKVNLITNQISQLEYEVAQQQQIEQAHEQRVASSVDSFDALMDQIELKKYVGDGPDCQILKIRLKRAFHAQAEELSKQLKDANLAFTEQLKSAQDRENGLQEKLTQEQNAHLQTTLELQDANSKRDAAAAELEEAKKEIAQLKSWNQDLREQAAFGVSGSLNIIDDEELKHQEAELEKQRLKDRTIYDIAWTDELKKTYYTAKKAINDEVIEFPYYEKSKYNVIDVSEVSQFRGQYATAEQQPTAEVPSANPAPVQNSVDAGSTFPSIPTPEVPTVSLEHGSGTADQAGTGSAGQDGAVTRQEHEELKQRVAALEAKATQQNVA